MNEETLFHLALQKAAGERAAFLEKACAGDAGLRQRLEVLIQAHDQPGSFLESPGPAMVATLDEPMTERPGTVIGPYKLLQQIGEGGFGVVFMAEQEQPVRRRVALKVIKPGMHSTQVVARFEAERQALAMMDHINSAKVLDAGATETGRPYFVMELVNGVAITKYCDENKLTPRERLELFVPVCQAIQHAHQKGIIHRDIKPSNVLLPLYDGKPVPKIIDFGVAKAIDQRLTERTLFTQFGTLVGTFEYMSPEQAEFSALGVDTRSDVYSLGVLLYELLTGTTPLERARAHTAALDEVLRLIREEEPPKPSTRLSSCDKLPSIAAARKMEPLKLAKLLRGELDWILMKALEKDRTRRYESPSAFARDVQCYLTDEPVEACPPSVRYRLGKFVRKNRTLVATAGAFAGVLALGIVGLIVGIILVNKEQQRTADALTQVSAEKEKTQAALAAESLGRNRTRAALNTTTDEVIRDVIGHQPQLGNKERALLRKLLGYYEGFAAELGETQEARDVAAEGLFRVAQIRAFLEENAEAETGYRRAIQLYEKLTGDLPEKADYRYRLVLSHTNLGALLLEMGKRTEAETVLRRAIDLGKSLAADFRAVPDYRNSLVNAHSNLGLVLREVGKREEAETVYRQGIDVGKKLVADFPDTPEYRRELAAICRRLASLLHFDTDKQADAERYVLEAVALGKKLAADSPGVPDYRYELGRSYNSLGYVFYHSGKHAEAESVLREGIASQEKLAAEFPSVPTYRHWLAWDHYTLAYFLSGMQKWSEGETEYRHAIALQEKLVHDFPAVLLYRTTLADSYIFLGSLVRDRGQPAAALDWYRKAMPLLEPLLAQDRQAALARRFLRYAHGGEAGALNLLGRHAEALQDRRRVVELDDGLEGNEPRLYLAIEIARTGKHAEAIAEAEAILKPAALGTKSLPSAEDFYHAARVYGQAAAAAKTDAKLGDRYASRALAPLNRAESAGFFKMPRRVDAMKRVKDLDPLRQRADFQDLVKKLEAEIGSK